MQKKEHILILLRPSTGCTVVFTVLKQKWTQTTYCQYSSTKCLLKSSWQGGGIWTYIYLRIINSVVESTHHQGQSQQHTEHLPFMHVEVVHPGSLNKRNWGLKWNSATSYTFWASHGQVDSMRHSDSGTRMGKFGPNSALLGNVCTVGLVTSIIHLLKPLNWTKYLSPIYNYCTVRKSEKGLTSLEILHHLHNCRNLHTVH